MLNRATLDNGTKWSMGGVLGHMVSAQPVDETKGQPHGQPTSLCDQTPYKRWTPRLRWASLIGNTLCLVTYCCQEKLALSVIPLGQDNWKFHALNFPLLCPGRFSWLILICILLLWLNYNHGYNSFWWVLWVFLAKYWSWGWSWGCPDFVKGSSKSSLSRNSMLLFAKFPRPFPNCTKVLLNVHLGFSCAMSLPQGIKESSLGQMVN